MATDGSSAPWFDQRREMPRPDQVQSLTAARLRDIAGTTWSAKRYFNIELLKDQQIRGAITA